MRLSCFCQYFYKISAIELSGFFLIFVIKKIQNQMKNFSVFHVFREKNSGNKILKIFFSRYFFVLNVTK